MRSVLAVTGLAMLLLATTVSPSPTEAPGVSPRADAIAALVRERLASRLGRPAVDRSFVEVIPTPNGWLAILHEANANCAEGLSLPGLCSMIDGTQIYREAYTCWFDDRGHWLDGERIGFSATPIVNGQAPGNLCSVGTPTTAG
jgi:hypothetical protein